MLKGFAGLASAAAASTLNAGKEVHKALELLELGRGVIAGLLLDLRTDISDLRQQHPSLADEFASLRNELDSPAEQRALSAPDRDTHSQESQARRRREANQRFEELIEEIRCQPGLQRFLLPPTADELMVAAQEGPAVVVNVSPYRCDAFLIERYQIRALPLPGLNLEELEKKLQELRTDRSLLTSSGQMEETLEWLWDVVTCPVLEALGFQSPIQDDKWPRIWWIPTGLLSHFPLHAAGCHINGSTETVLDRVMSSYSPSIKALVYGRQNSKNKSEHTALEDALLVSMPNTPGQLPLSFAEQEVAKLKELYPLMQLNPVEPSQKNREDVLECLRTSKIFHFAGHGLSHPTEPSQSSLLLSDWQTSPLTVADLRDQKLQESSPFLGYLSACSTGANNAQQLTDEAIHLVSALQLAGFRHVVGTLWEVSDPHCVEVAVTLYETLRDEGMTDQAVCRGLHRALRALRDNDRELGQRMDGNCGAVNVEIVHPSRLERDAILYDDEGREARQRSPLYWVPYIHFGV